MTNTTARVRNMEKDEMQAALFQARIDGLKAGLELAERVLRVHRAASIRQSVAAQTKSRPRYDWIDHACGISLIDRMMGIK